MTMKSPNEVFEHLLQDMYYAEKKLVKALPKMAEASSNEDLKKAFEEHLEETKGHVDRIKKVLEMLGLEVSTEKCPAMDGLVKEGEELMKDIEKGTLRDVALIAAAQKVEHYEIASYGTLCELARTTGNDDAHDILGETLEEEKAADSKLSKLAEQGINEEGMSQAA